MIRNIKTHDAEDFCTCGAKAYHLAQLSAAGFCVPAFLCLEQNDLSNMAAVRRALHDGGIQPLYAVRSSADVEDGAKESFAGQFLTCLYVNDDDLEAQLHACFESMRKVHVPYHNSEVADNMHVVVQKMISAELSGVFFTQNPLGILSETVTVVGSGNGEGVVGDRVATTTYYNNLPDGVCYHVSQLQAPVLPDRLYQQLLADRAKMEALFGAGLDIEYAVADDKLYYLQARAITSLKHEQMITLDSSNIVESYPGMTLPLTADFVSQQYTSIFKGVITRLSGSKALSQKHSGALDHMVECWNGRMYYRIENWYGVIGLLPFSQKIVPLWREMLGVHGDGDIAKPFAASVMQKSSIAFHTIYYFFCSPKKMLQLGKAFAQIEQEYLSMSKKEMSLQQLRDFLLRMESRVMAQWDYTLINDMYTFLHTGIAKKLMGRRGLSEQQVQEAIADITQLASMQPVRELLEMAQEWKAEGENETFCDKKKTYLLQYGDRSVGELKLETETFREKPEQLMAQIQSYARNPQLDHLLTKMKKEKMPLPVHGLAAHFLKCAKKGIENREISRMNRTRLFGFARSVFLRAGEILQAKGHLSQARDVFYLTVDEVFDGDKDYRSLIEQRKLVTDSWSVYPAYSRVVFDGRIVPKPCHQDAVQADAGKAGLLKGTPCSSGKAAGEVLLVDNPESAGDTSNKILVTRSTDPGWAFLLTPASGLISEKGSLLSHTAIISRELQIPAIVAVPNATKLLHTGDFVEMDCETGLIRIIQKDA